MHIQNYLERIRRETKLLKKFDIWYLTSGDAENHEIRTYLDDDYTIDSIRRDYEDRGLLVFLIDRENKPYHWENIWKGKGID